METVDETCLIVVILNRIVREDLTEMICELRIE